MAYNEFAYFYDELNSEADYDALTAMSPTNWRPTVSATASWPTWAAVPAI